VLFAGRLDGELKWASFAAAELFLLPSREENLAITIAEAMQMGLPVIISDKVDTWPYVKEGVLVLFWTSMISTDCSHMRSRNC
jgi:glycosyltransferase involved in cell wall biosynthesis